MGWCSAQVYNHCQNKETKDGDNLNAGKYEFRFSIYGDSDDVEDNDNGQNNGDPRSRLGAGQHRNLKYTTAHLR